MEVLKNMEKRMLRYDFSAIEIHTLSVDLANKNLQYQTVSDEKKTATSQYKSKLDSIQADLNSLSNKVASAGMK